MSSCFVAPTSEVMYTIVIALVIVQPPAAAPPPPHCLLTSHYRRIIAIPCTVHNKYIANTITTYIWDTSTRVSSVKSCLDVLVHYYYGMSHQSIGVWNYNYVHAWTMHVISCSSPVVKTHLKNSPTKVSFSNYWNLFIIHEWWYSW